MERQTEPFTSYVTVDEWVCIFCTSHNALKTRYCHTCGLSFKGGVPESEPARSAAPSMLTRAASPIAEIVLAGGLFAMWKIGDIASGTSAGGAVNRGRAVWDIERGVDLPSEASVQGLVVHHATLVHALDGYYAVAHLGGMIALAGWLYVRHRASYARWRNAVVATTAVCFLIQLMSVAPPRLVSGLGIVDTASRDGESVYGHAGFANQLSSMPSVHMAWALIFAAAVGTTAPGRKRWLGILHPILTLAAIVLTGNHYWLDAVVAGLVTVLVIRFTRQHHGT